MYNGHMMKHLFKSVYGSKLYGTNTATSDTDEKVVYLPAFDDILLGRKLATYKERFDADGNHVAANASMPDNGVETEFVAFQTFCRDYLNGQTYALEVVMAHAYGEGTPKWMKELHEKFTTCNVASMAGFAMKQTFDYVHRGRRLNAARKTLGVLKAKTAFHQEGRLSLVRLDLPVSYMVDENDQRVSPAHEQALHELSPEADHGLHVRNETLLDAVAREAELELGETVNNGRKMRTLKLNGREYLETTTLEHLKTALEKLVDEYGDRSNRAAAEAVDTKSLSHAVRVYEQALELLECGNMRFPRQNVKYLLDVKQGLMDPEIVKARLLELEVKVTEAQKSSKLLPAKTSDLEDEFEVWLLKWLRKLYNLR